MKLLLIRLAAVLGLALALPLDSLPGIREPMHGGAAKLAADLFAGGAEAEVDHAVTGDAFVAGGEVRLRGKVEGDAVLAGGEVTVEDDVDDDLYAAGGRVRIAANVRGNARLAGGRVVVEPAGDIRGRASIAGGEVEVAGRVGGGLAVHASRVRVDGAIGGDVVVVARTLSVGPGARIAGRLKYRGPRPADISPSAVVAGGVEHESGATSQRLAAWGARALAWVTAILLLLGILALGSVLVFAAPVFSAQAADGIVRRPGRVLALGLALLVGVPAAAVLAIATLVGIPLGVFLLLCYSVLLLLGCLVAALCLGDRLVRLRPGARGEPLTGGWRMTGLAVALALLLALASVPLVGWVFLLLALTSGIGALALRTWESLTLVRRTAAPG